MKKELLKKQELVLKLGMEFDEVANVFSEETLSSMAMSHAVGGEEHSNGNNCSCFNVWDCDCSNTQCNNCSTTNVSCPTTNVVVGTGCQTNTVLIGASGCMVTSNTNELLCGCASVSVSVTIPLLPPAP